MQTERPPTEGPPTRSNPTRGIVLLAAAVAVTVQGLGALLVLAVLIAPPVAVRDYARTPARAMLAGAYSSRLVLPKKIAPAARSFAIMVASCGGLSLAYAAAAPAVVRISAVS